MEYKHLKSQSQRASLLKLLTRMLELNNGLRESKNALKQIVALVNQ